MSIRNRLLIIFFVLTAFPMLFVGTLSFFNAKEVIEKQTISALERIAELKAEQIEDYFRERKGDATAVRRYPSIIKNLPLISKMHEGEVTPEHIKAIKELNDNLEVIQQAHNYEDVFLVNDEGLIVYSSHEIHPSPHVGMKLDDLAGGIFDRGKESITLGDVFLDTRGSHHYSLLVAAPVHDYDGKFIGEVVFEVDMSLIYSKILETKGLGLTGETLIAKNAGDAALFLNPLRYDPGAALKRKEAFSKEQILPIQRALQGGIGWGLSVDYRGEKVLAAWRYIPSLDWGIVAKIDEEEAFASVKTLQNLNLMLAASILIIGFIIALYLSKSISDPIRALQKGAEIIGDGNLDYKIGTADKDEIGELSRSFDAMTENLKKVTASRNELDMEVEERKIIEEKLHKRSHELFGRNKELNCLYNISRLVDKAHFSIDELLQEIARIIPPSWQYPEITCARITLEGTIFQTRNFNESSWKQSSNLLVYGEKVGLLEVFYLEERPKSDEGPFLQEERNLIDAIAERLGGIIEQKRAEEERRRLSTAIEQSAETIIITDVDGIIQYVNPAFESISGYSSEESIGKSIRFMKSGKHSKAFYKNIWETISSGETWSGYFINKRKDGALFEEDATISPVRGTSGEIVNYVAVKRDITEKKKAALAFRDSELRYRALFDSVGDAILIHDMGEKFLEVNSVACERLGYSREELLDMKPADILTSQFIQLMPKWIKDVKKAGNIVMEAEHKTKEGGIIPIELNSRLIDYAGEKAILNVARDITLRKEAEEELRKHREHLEELVEERTSDLKAANVQLQEEMAERMRAQEGMKTSASEWKKTFDTITDIIMIVDNDSNILRVNEAATNAFNLDYKDILGKKCYELLHGTSEHPENCPHKRAIGERVESSEEVYEKKYDKDFLVRIVPMIDSSGGVYGTVHTIRDITEKKKAEEAKKKVERELDDQKARAISADRLRSLGEMAAGIAHELNQPLMGVRGQADHIMVGMKRGWDISEDKLLGKINIIIEQADRMAHIIDHVRTFASGAEGPELVPVQVNQVIKDGIGLIGAQLRFRGMDLECTLADGLPDVKANPFSLEEVILNLISNARDSLEEKLKDGSNSHSKIITLRTLLEKKSHKKRVRIEIKDEGTGIPPDILDKVYDPFFTTKDPDKGTGLGLAISKSIIEGLGGEMDIKSKLGAGTTVAIFLPGIKNSPRRR